jgi:hypothetical protein
MLGLVDFGLIIPLMGLVLASLEIMILGFNLVIALEM